MDYRESDQRIWEEELEEFIPACVFDAHVHLFDRRHLPTAADRTDCTWSDADLNTLRDWSATIFPHREVHWLTLGTPVLGIDPVAHASWMREQIALDQHSRMHRLVTPACRVEEIRRELDESHGQLIGLKPYRIFATTGDASQCRIHEFLPPEQLELADERRLWITMHLSRYDGCADAANLNDLEDFTTRRYPNVRWILAHCARSFTYWPIRHAIDRLKHLPNIWYDVSAVTDVRPLVTLFHGESTDRILYGSDGIDSTSFHGKYVALGRSWQALDSDRISLRFPHCDGRPILAVYEQLLAIKHATEFAEWTRDQVEALFWRNAARLFHITFDGD